jgi:hypothetical protein
MILAFGINPGALVFLVLLGTVLGVNWFLTRYLVRIPLPLLNSWMKSPVRCPLCDQLAPVFRIPENERQVKDANHIPLLCLAPVLWILLVLINRILPQQPTAPIKGGWTCRGCGAELNMYGGVESFSAKQARGFQELSTKFLPESRTAKDCRDPNHSMQELPGA